MSSRLAVKRKSYDHRHRESQSNEVLAFAEIYILGPFLCHFHRRVSFDSPPTAFVSFYIHSWQSIRFEGGRGVQNFPHLEGPQER